MFKTCLAPFASLVQKLWHFVLTWFRLLHPSPHKQNKQQQQTLHDKNLAKKILPDCKFICKLQGLLSHTCLVPNSTQTLPGIPPRGRPRKCAGVAETGQNIRVVDTDVNYFGPEMDQIAHCITRQGHEQPRHDKTIRDTFRPPSTGLHTPEVSVGTACLVSCCLLAPVGFSSKQMVPAKYWDPYSYPCCLSSADPSPKPHLQLHPKSNSILMCLHSLSLMLHRDVCCQHLVSEDLETNTSAGSTMRRWMLSHFQKSVPSSPAIQRTRSEPPLPQWGSAVQAWSADAFQCPPLPCWGCLLAPSLPFVSAYNQRSPV